MFANPLRNVKLMEIVKEVSVSRFQEEILGFLEKTNMVRTSELLFTWSGTKALTPKPYSVYSRNKTQNAA